MDPATIGMIVSGVMGALKSGGTKQGDLPAGFGYVSAYRAFRPGDPGIEESSDIVIDQASGLPAARWSYEKQSWQPLVGFTPQGFPVFSWRGAAYESVLFTVYFDLLTVKSAGGDALTAPRMEYVAAWAALIGAPGPFAGYAPSVFGPEPAIAGETPRLSPRGAPLAPVAPVSPLPLIIGAAAGFVLSRGLVGALAGGAVAALLSRPSTTGKAHGIGRPTGGGAPPVSSGGGRTR